MKKQARETVTTRSAFDETFAQLKTVLEPYAEELTIRADTKDLFGLDTQHVMRNKQRLYFGAVKKNKSYVTLHLMPVYACPDLLKNVSPELMKRMHGKGCFNFKEPLDDKVLKELRKLTKTSFAKFTDEDFINTLLGSR